MIYNKKDVVTSISIMLFIISFAIVFTVFFKGLYYSDIYRLGIDKQTGLSIATIKENYDILIAYQSIFYQGSLEFKDFIMSTSGRIHFEEVKNIFVAIQVLLGISTVTSIIMIRDQIKNKEYRFLKLTSIITIVIPIIIGLLASIDFSKAFEIFHQLVFRNDYWVFNARIDPIITILPEVYFMHAFIMIVVIVIVLALVCLGIYRYLNKRSIRDYNY